MWAEGIGGLRGFFACCDGWSSRIRRGLCWIEGVLFLSGLRVKTILPYYVIWVSNWNASKMELFLKWKRASGRKIKFLFMEEASNSRKNELQLKYALFQAELFQCEKLILFWGRVPLLVSALVRIPHLKRFSFYYFRVIGRSIDDLDKLSKVIEEIYFLKNFPYIEGDHYFIPVRFILRWMSVAWYVVMVDTYI